MHRTVLCKKPLLHRTVLCNEALLKSLIGPAAWHQLQPAHLFTSRCFLWWILSPMVLERTLLHFTPTQYHLQINPTQLLNKILLNPDNNSDNCLFKNNLDQRNWSVWIFGLCSWLLWVTTCKDTKERKCGGEVGDGTTIKDSFTLDEDPHFLLFCHFQCHQTFVQSNNKTVFNHL